MRFMVSLSQNDNALMRTILGQTLVIGDYKGKHGQDAK
jgi:hypothetical protein